MSAGSSRAHISRSLCIGRGEAGGRSLPIHKRREVSGGIPRAEGLARRILGISDKPEEDTPGLQILQTLQALLSPEPALAEQSRHRTWER